ncbi:hypothetical protein [Methylotenera sp.]|uniref:hypothetical protein n=1 Tax=Methylotenera sp. TaxID=2051956 RepID=UPI00248A1E80|nr:hypothetical protein [Methylotenera sp.]MDI1362571.1 hypothetical protein [Methylotenera sp.]
MTTWHQQQAISRNKTVLYHPTKWTCYNSAGHTGVMRFDTPEEAFAYAENTGDAVLAPQGELNETSI